MRKASDPLAAVGQSAVKAVASMTARNEAIRTAHDEGCSLRAIAEVAGLSVEGVRRIIARTVTSPP